MSSVSQVQKVVTPRDPYAALRFRDFRLFQAGWMLGVMGDQIAEAAVGLDVYRRTHNPMSLGWVGLVSAAPVILLALPAGHLADRFDRKRIVIATQVVRTLCLLALAALSILHGGVGTMYAVLFVSAAGKAVGWPARSAMLPNLVPPEVFPNAVAWNSSTFQISSMAGPALCGVLLLRGVTVAYIGAAIFAVIFGLMTIPLRPRVVENQRREPVTFASLIAGVRYVTMTKIILATITLDLFAVLLGGGTYLLPVFATDVLHVGPVGYGWMLAAPAVGALIMGVIVAHLPPIPRAGQTMLWAVAGFGVAWIIFGLSKNYWLSLTALFFTGAMDNISVMVRHTLVQVLTPDEMRGRVSAVNNVFIGSSNELGGFESGLTAHLFGKVTSIVAGGIGTLIVVGLTGIIWPEVRAFGSLADARPQTPIETPTDGEPGTEDQTK